MRVQEKLLQFIPVADEVGYLQRTEGAEGVLFRKIAEQGHYAGRVKPTNTRQGIYACTANGTFLGSVNTRRADDVLRMLDRAIQQWESLPSIERAPVPNEAATQSEFPGAGWRFRQLYPSDGLVMRVHSRDVAREADDAMGDWRDGASNRDYAWFRVSELEAIVPTELEVGSTQAWPSAVTRRIARLHLVDNVRGQVPSYEDRDVVVAEVTSKIDAVDEASCSLLFDGTFEVSTRPPNEEESSSSRGFEARLLGRADYDRVTHRLTNVEWVVVGERWGQTKYNGREGDGGRAGIGYVFVEADATERAEPALFWEYGWR